MDAATRALIERDREGAGKEGLEEVDARKLAQSPVPQYIDTVARG